VKSAQPIRGRAHCGELLAVIGRAFAKANAIEVDGLAERIDLRMIHRGAGFKVLTCVALVAGTVLQGAKRMEDCGDFSTGHYVDHGNAS
jgi:hypothetical protein